MATGGLDLGRRVAVAIPALAVTLALLAVGGWPWAAALAALGTACLLELEHLLPEGRPLRVAAVAGLVGVLVAGRTGGGDVVLGVLVAVLPLAFAVALGRRLSPLDPAALGACVLGVAWIGGGLAHGVLLRDLEHGAGLVVCVLAGTFVGDTGAQIGGSQLGRRKLAPDISPNKTVEGLLIGFVTGILAVLVAGRFVDGVSDAQALALGAAVVVAAPLGDLLESSLKRARGVKDSGRMFGAHGGALDRIDALLLSAVAGYWTWMLVA